MPNLSEKLAELDITANPFAPDTPLESLFAGGMRRASLDQLQLLARESGDIIALIGPDGSGKSILADFFARRAERDQIVARTRASMLTSPSQLLQEMFKAFVLDFPPQASIAELKQVLAHYFRAVQMQSRTVVLIVDDAHELGDDAFSLLTKLALTENAGGTFHLILVGQVSLLDMLDYTCPQREGNNQFTSIRLPEFHLDETRNYLRYRLNMVGFNDKDPARGLPFSNRQVEKIHRLSEGVPAAINQLANEMLFVRRSRLAWLGALSQFTPLGLPRHYAYAAGALALALVLAFVVGGGDEPQTTAQRQITVPVPVSQVATLAQTDTGPQADALPSPFAAPPVVDDEPEPVPAATEPIAIRTPSTQEAVVDVANAASTAATPAPTPTPAATPVTASTPATAPARPAASSTPASPSAPTTLAEHRARILGMPSNQFTVQLLGASSRANVEAFIKRNATSPLYWFETQNQGRPWYVVIHGAYPSRGAAQSAASALTGELGRLQPWVRSLGAVQNDIQASN